MSVALLALAALALLTAPRWIEWALNRRGRPDLSRCTPAARALHRRLWIADLHADSCPLAVSREPSIRVADPRPPNRQPLPANRNG